MLLVAEVLHGFEVQKTVYSLGVRIRVGIVHPAPDVHPPLGGGIGVPDVEDHRDDDDRGIAPAEGPDQKARHQHDLENGRNGVEEGEAQHRVDAHGAAGHDARQAARAALEVKLQRQGMEVAESGHRQFAHGALADLGEDRIAQLCERHHHDATEAIGQHEEEHDGCGRGGCTGSRAQRIGRIFEGVGRRHRHDLRQHQGHHGEDHPGLQARMPGRPQIGHHVPQDGPLVAIRP